jgi:predicted  nucleic acid-binding Zn-ribbon protein
MPHQCLKCGKVFPSGSPEILKGCGDCGGKRFFYTEQAVSDNERERLIEQANKDIKVLIREILAQSQRDKFDFYDEDGKAVPGVKPDGKADWVKISPRKTKGSKTDEGLKGKGGDVEGADGTDGTVEDAEDHKIPTVKQILQELKDSLPEGEGGKKKLKRDKSGKLITKKKGVTKDKSEEAKGKAKRKVKPIRRKRGREPEIITVKEPGVYNIQLDKLMKGFPIIIYRDGSYLVHLPSVFESIERGRK